MARYVQVFQRTGIVKRQAVDAAGPPVIGLVLEDHWRLVSLEARPLPPERRRVTVDWAWTATIEADLGHTDQTQETLS